MSASIDFYDSFKELIADGTIDLDTHTFKLLLLTDGYTFDATDVVKTDLGATEHANQDSPGYQTGGKALSDVTWGQISGTATFNATDVEWTATGDSIVAKYAVLYDDDASDSLVLCVTLDSSAVTVTAGNTLTVQWNESGIFTLA